MKRTWIIVFLIMAGAFSLSACQDGKGIGDAEDLVDAWFESYLAASSLADDFWGMDIYNVFGPVCPNPDWFGGLNHNKTNRIEETGNFEVRYLCWLKGKDAGGSPVKISRDVVVSVNYESSTDRMNIESYRFENEKPLSGWKQIGLWLLWSTVGPIIPLYFVIFALSDWWAILNAYPIIKAILFLVWVVYVGQVSHWIFGSIWAVIIGIIIFIILVWFLSGFVKVLQQLRGSTR